MLRRDYFNSPRMYERERLAFILAAYNVGAERVQGLRAEARRRGLNPNRWFFQVERVAASELGMGVVNYVSSINKYYLAYQRERDGLEPRQRVASARK
jgi:membrane-bound lytic murein transglycosylase MltF